MGYSNTLYILEIDRKSTEGYIFFFNGTLDVDKETDKWRVEFGEEDAVKLRIWVDFAMPDYEYLRARKLIAEDSLKRGS